LKISLIFVKNHQNLGVGVKKAPRFTHHQGERLPNPEWRPFVATVSKAAHRKGEMPNRNDFKFSTSGVKETFAILSSFYNFLLQEEYVFMNPVSLIRQKSKFIRVKPKSNKNSKTQRFAMENGD
jgi:site-specific recombinase XerD